jgi:hypothetical protein
VPDIKPGVYLRKELKDLLDGEWENKFLRRLMDAGRLRVHPNPRWEDNIIMTYEVLPEMNELEKVQADIANAEKMLKDAQAKLEALKNPPKPRPTSGIRLGPSGGVWIHSSNETGVYINSVTRDVSQSNVPFSSSMTGDTFLTHREVCKVIDFIEELVK